MTHDKNQRKNNHPEDDANVEVDPMAEFETDPMAEFETQESSLDWPDKHQKIEGAESVDAEPTDTESSNPELATKNEASAAKVEGEKTGDDSDTNEKTTDDEQGPLEVSGTSESGEQGPLEVSDTNEGDDHDPLQVSGTNENEAEDKLKKVDSSDLFIADNEIQSHSIENPQKKRSLFGRKRKNKKNNIAQEFNSDVDAEKKAVNETRKTTEEHSGKTTTASSTLDNLHHLENYGNQKPKKIVTGAGKVVFASTLTIGVMYLFFKVMDLQRTQGNESYKVKQQLSAQIESFEGRVVAATDELEQSINLINSQISSLKTTTEKNEQVLGGLANGSSNQLDVEAIKKMIEVDRTVITKLDASIENIESRLSELKKQPAPKTVKPTTPRRATPRKPQTRTIRNVAGYSLFSVDVWGNTPLLVLVKGENIIRVKKGEVIGGWKVIDIDSYQKKATLQRGNIINHLQG